MEVPQEDVPLEPVDEPEPTPLEDEAQQADNDGADEEEEDECRVCRGTAEEGRPLFTPCKCSGSMGMIHQDCLTSWLEVTRGDGRCEICKTKFRFDPQYAENAPDRLPAHEVFLGLSSRFVAKWLPLAIRISIAASSWLIVAPLLTNCLYHGWMVRPSSILTRWKRELILSDIVSGAVMAAIIIISFLSLMSFADFLRVHWQQAPRDQQQQGGEQQQRRNDGLGANTDGNNEEDDDMIVVDDAIDDGVMEFAEKCRQKSQEDPKQLTAEMADSTEEANRNGTTADECIDGQPDQSAIAKTYAEQAKQLRELVMERESRREHAATNLDQATPGEDEKANEIELLEDAPVGPRQEGVIVEDVEDEEDDLDDPVVLIDEMEDGWIDEQGDEEDENENEDVPPPLMQPPRREAEQNNGARAFDAMDPVLQDDQVDMEINVALDELLGLRGPISALIRNLLWLLAFNATYLGIFGFVPRTVGSVVYSGILNTTFSSNMLKTIPLLDSDDENRTTVVSLLSALEQESIDRNTTFKLSDFATVTLGYLSIALMVVMSRYALIVFQKVGQKFDRNPSSRGQNNHDAPRLHRANVGHNVNDFEEDAVDGPGLGASLVVALDTTVAIVKVGVLLFLKMFLLPLFLGFFLDASTVHFFGHDVARRLAFAGSDLFSFILLHWVAGITFMLLVTVFLLQLREVAHPDVLARLIRPQEPQPDLLGNLMHETVFTHMKRMMLSLAIYAPLLLLHVYLPIKLFMASGLEASVPFFHLNFYHLVMPQLQIPLELITFHLSMLALLERYKNSIGGLQHRWMKFMCRKLGLTDYLLPKEVEGLELIGSKAVFLPRDDHVPLQVDPFFVELVSKEGNVDQFVESNIDKRNDSQPRSIVHGEIRASGERVLSIGTTHISIPANDGDGKPILLPTKLGRYRLQLRDFDSDLSLEPTVEFFREIQGEEIRRPPEGWDDLGAGGAFVQGRWAWGRERKSVVEGSVAQRTSFRASSKHRIPFGLTMKVIALLMLSWIAITLTSIVIISMPLAIGRSFYYLLRIPEKYIHDPLAFCLGGALFFPAVSILAQNTNSSNESLLKRTVRWISRFRRPPSRKLFVALESFFLWFFAAPMALGLSYDLGVVKSQKWFAREEKFYDWKSIAFSFVMGTVVLNTWSFLLYFNCLSRQFWANIGNGILEAPVDGNGNNDGIFHARNQDIDAGGRENVTVDGQEIPWQGNQGRVAKFFKIWRSVLCNWEWDSIDRTSLLDDFARPVTRQLASALVGSFLSFQMVMYLVISILKVQQGGIPLPFLGIVEYGMFRKTIFRMCMALHVLVQLASGFRANIDRWFEAAHGAARDDRYLIGELLMNYSPDQVK